MRLDKFLSDMGIDTRSEIKKQIRRGNVKVDGNVEKNPAAKVDFSNKVTYLGEMVAYEEYQYYMLNKPGDVLTATIDKKQPTVMDLFKGEGRKDLFPVGRLDKDTLGLLLITNDGTLAHNLLSPKKHVPKVYYAEVAGELSKKDICKFEAGIVINEDFTAMPAILEIEKTDKEQSSAFVTVYEGKFHQVKKMFEAVGKPVEYLKRVKMGSLSLDETLKPGQYRVLTPQEIDYLKNIGRDLQ